jgi:hypothetical protein
MDIQGGAGSGSILQAGAFGDAKRAVLGSERAKGLVGSKALPYALGPRAVPLGRLLILPLERTDLQFIT